MGLLAFMPPFWPLATVLSLTIASATACLFGMVRTFATTRRRREVVFFGGVGSFLGFAATLFIVWYSQHWPLGAWVSAGFGVAGFALQLWALWNSPEPPG